MERKLEPTGRSVPLLYLPVVLVGSDIAPIVILAEDVTVGCKDKLDKGCITTFAGTELSAVWREVF